MLVEAMDSERVLHPMTFATDVHRIKFAAPGGLPEGSMSSSSRLFHLAVQVMCVDGGVERPSFMRFDDVMRIHGASEELSTDPSAGA